MIQPTPTLIIIEVGREGYGYLMEGCYSLFFLLGAAVCLYIIIAQIQKLRKGWQK